MSARIRTIKPEFFRHEKLFHLEKSSGLPLRLAFAGIWTCCDREGRFKWRPNELKLDCLPYDDVDFSRVLDALTTGGFLVRYASQNGDYYGYVPSWKHHQFVNAKERQSILPSPAKSIISQRVNDSLSTRDDAMTKLALGEGKGREGKEEAKKPPAAAGNQNHNQKPEDPADLIWKTGVALLVKTGAGEAAARSFLGQFAGNGKQTKLAEVIGYLASNPKVDPKAYIVKAMTGGGGVWAAEAGYM